jgi:predicted nucleic acid-binding Zn finger protein
MSKDLLLKLVSIVKKKNKIDDEILNFLNLIFSEKAERILETIKRGITKYYVGDRVIWVAMGENSEHIVYPKIYCSCQDFYLNVVIDRKRDFCKHILAQIICEVLNNYKEKKISYNEFRNLFKDELNTIINPKS